MGFLKSFGRLLVLIALFGIGLGLIRHIGLNYYPLRISTMSAPAIVLPRPEMKQPLPVSHLEFPYKTAPTKAVALAGMLGVARTDRGQFIVTDPILFNSGSSTLREPSVPRLNKVVEFLIRHPNMTLEIVGHADNLGPESANQKVSAERAEIVMNYLIAQGIAALRLRSRGMGSLNPIDSNDTKLGRQANRRAEFLITGDLGVQ